LRIDGWSIRASDVDQHAPEQQLEKRLVNSIVGQPRFETTLMSYNIWNFDDGGQWAQRAALLAQIMRQSNATIIGVQESRMRFTANAKSQLQDLVRRAPHIHAAASHLL
jgi:endonuclease/exonuclease/phosphatase family metal-dependent hydrolase